MTDSLLFTPSGVRLRRHRAMAGGPRWLLLPGGPGIGSESLEGLADALDVPGEVWLVDLPGDGSNRAPPGAGEDPFALWPGVLVEAAQALPGCVFVGHSTGGMYLLATPALEGLVLGLVLVSSAPDASWMPRFVAMTEDNPLPAVAAAAEAYEREKTDARLGEIAVASAPWNFTLDSVEAGAALLAAMPYNRAAVDWSDREFDHDYAAAWWPQALPVLIVSGGEDRIVDQSLWDAARFDGANVIRRTIKGAAHFPWVERPEAVRQAFRELAARLAV
jgi:pimeloyl-ACP methyl ester carboxylesterase